MEKKEVGSDLTKQLKKEFLDLCIHDPDAQNLATLKARLEYGKSIKYDHDVAFDDETLGFWGVSKSLDGQFAKITAAIAAKEEEEKKEED